MHRSRRAAIILWLVTAFAVWPAPAWSDEVILTYGDRISGHIVFVTRDVVRVETSAAGVIQIQRTYVDQLTTDEPRAIDLISGERVIGQIIAASGKMVTIRSSLLGEHRVSLATIDAIHALSDPLSQIRGRGTGATTRPFQQPADLSGTQEPRPIGQEPEDAEDIRLIFLRESAVLLRPGQIEVDTAISYQHSQSVSSILNARFRHFQLPWAARVGLFNRAEGSVSLPLSYVQRDLGFADQVISREELGIGDVTAGFNYELTRETARGPDVITSVGFAIPTGSKPDEEGLSLGTGHWAAAFGVQFIKIVDPIALFGGIRYDHQFAARYFLGDDVHEVDPGETTGYNFGFGFAVNERISLSAQVSGSYQADAKADGEKVFASSREPVSLRTALTYQYSSGTYVEPSIAIGLVDDTADFGLGISLTHRFGQ